jgi:hypothetical protein
VVAQDWKMVVSTPFFDSTGTVITPASERADGDEADLPKETTPEIPTKT